MAKPDTRKRARHRPSYRHSLAKATPAGVAGQRMRSTKHFKAQALAILANPTLSIADRARMLEMVRITCAMFMKAQREGVALDDRIVLERDPVMSPAEARRAAREAGEGRYRGQPCPTCGGTERFTCDARCATCKPGYFDHLEASHG